MVCKLCIMDGIIQPSIVQIYMVVWILKKRLINCSPPPLPFKDFHIVTCYVIQVSLIPPKVHMYSFKMQNLSCPVSHFTDFVNKIWLTSIYTRNSFFLFPPPPPNHWYVVYLVKVIYCRSSNFPYTYKRLLSSIWLCMILCIVFFLVMKNWYIRKLITGPAHMWLPPLMKS